MPPAPLIGVIVQHHGWSAGFLMLAALTAALPATIAFSRDTDRPA
jgi:hypothetical protein